MAGLTFIKKTGTTNINVALADGSTAVVPVTCSIVTPVLPQRTVDTTMPARPGTTHTVNTMADLNTALAAVQLGDQIVITNTAVLNGSPTFPKVDVGPGAWITVRTSAEASLPATGTRAHPMDAIYMPQFVADGSQPYGINLAPGAHHYRFVGIEFTVASSITYLNRIFEAGNGFEVTADIPHDIIFDRCYVHGHSALQCCHGIGLQSAASAVVDSYVSEIHGSIVGGASVGDAQAIATWGSPGPLLIHNTYCEGGDENISFGGADVVNTNQLPTDITVTNNYLFKPPAWRGQWQCKNLYEHKTGIHVLTEGNILENYWQDQQAFAVNFKSVNQDTNMPWAETRDVTFRYNIIRNAFAGYNFTAAPQNVAVPMSRVLAEHNLCDRLGAASDYSAPGSNFLMNINGAASPDRGIAGLTFRHNSGYADNYGVALSGDASQQAVIEDNIMGTGDAVVKGQSTTPGIPSLQKFFQPGWVFRTNIVIGGTSGEYPSTNYTPASVAVLNLNADYSLPTGSPYKGAASDGTDIGADIATILSKTSGVDATNKSRVGSVVNAYDSTNATGTGPYSAPAMNAGAGNTIVVGVSGVAAAAPATTISDTAGNTYTLVKQDALAAPGNMIALYVAYNCLGNASNVVTFTDTNVTYKAITVMQYAGCWRRLSPLDVAVGGNGGATGTYTTPAVSSGAANEVFVLLATQDKTGATLTIPASFTSQATSGMYLSDQFVRSAYNAAYTIPSSNAASTVQALVALFK